MTASTVALAGVALLRPSVEQNDGTQSSPWDLLLEWRHQGQGPQNAAKRLVSPLTKRNGILLGLHIQLRVEDESGNPVQGATVVCDRIMANSSGRVAQGSTNLSGDFGSTRLVHGDYEVRVQMPGFLPSDPQYWTLPLDGGAPKTIRLSRACVLRGHLEGLDGLPQNHGIVVITALDRDEEFEVKPDPEGGFAFAQLSTGDWTLRWKSHAQATVNPALQKNFSLVIGPTLEVEIVLTSELQNPPEEDPLRGVGIYAVEQN